MKPGNIYTIGSLGLAHTEENLLKSIGLLTKGRPRGGYAVNAEADIADSDIIVVNKDDPSALAKWRALAAKPNPPVMVLYVKEPPAEPNQHYLLRPFGPAKLLALLDGIVGQLSESAEVWKKPALSQAAAASTTNTTQRALVVDDSPTVCKQLELELRNFNVQADIAETGESGLELLAQHHYDLVFLDVVLPGMDGYQICKDIRKNPATKQTPVIMLTSKSSPFDRVRGSLVGCSAYLTKPVDYNAFREAVGKYVAT
jgi:two-component system, cell cycle response regulator